MLDIIILESQHEIVSKHELIMSFGHSLAMYYSLF